MILPDMIKHHLMYLFLNIANVIFIANHYICVLKGNGLFEETLLSLANCM